MVTFFNQSEEQKEVSQQFFKYVQKHFPEMEYNEIHLIRFCKARDFKINKIEEMFKAHVTWRNSVNIKDIKNTSFDGVEIQKLYPHGVHKTDKKGRPVFYERLGDINFDELYKVTNKQKLIESFISSLETMCHETMPMLSKHFNTNIDQCIVVLDLKGMKFKNLTQNVHKNIKDIIKVASDNYPEVLGQMFIVNAPIYFTGIWAMIKGNLNDLTKKKIKIIGNDYKNSLLEFIDIENLPNFLGGKSQCDLGENFVIDWSRIQKICEIEEKKVDNGHDFDDLNSKLQQLKVKQDRNESDSSDDDRQAQLEALQQMKGGFGIKKGPIMETPLNTLVDQDDDYHFDEDIEFKN